MQAKYDRPQMVRLICEGLIGPRIYSRLCADRNGAPMDLLVLDGADQRQHLLRGKAR